MYKQFVGAAFGINSKGHSTWTRCRSCCCSICWQNKPFIYFPFTVIFFDISSCVSRLRLHAPTCGLAKWNLSGFQLIYLPFCHMRLALCCQLAGKIREIALKSHCCLRFLVENGVSIASGRVNYSISRCWACLCAANRFKSGQLA